LVQFMSEQERLLEGLINLVRTYNQDKAMDLRAQLLNLSVSLERCVWARVGRGNRKTW